ncbi:MAG: NAD(P)-dependent oxidoreductase [Actinomycetia bacterium]|nr:NAD(P)-dependent oxidoreductase [Actinomycetes bacterium]
MTVIGIVGLGAMGAAIAGRLLEMPGNQVHGTNRTRPKAEPLIAQGLRWHDSPREVAASSEVLLSMVTDDAALSAIADGTDGILAGLRPGSLYIDMSTVSPQASRELAARVSAAGGAMIDAPVSGSVPAARDGGLAIMAGGTAESFKAAEPVLSQLGKVTHVGSNGHGLLLKLAINISLGAQMLAFSEGLLLAQRGGVDLAAATKVMTESAIGSPMLRSRVPLVLDLPDQAWFDVQLMHKDIRLAQQAGHEEGVPLPSAAAIEPVLREAEKLGYGHRDIAGLFEVLARATA